MESLHSKYVRCLDRENIVRQIEQFLSDFEKSKTDVKFPRGMYVYGASGVGKTKLVTNVLRELGYDFVTYDTGEVRNKHLIETMTADNMSDKNVLSMLLQSPEKNICRKRIVVLMDEIDGLNSGDKGGINSLIKLIRHKKTKKQKNEQMTVNPVICIGNYFSDKKIRELMKVCFLLEVKRPSIQQTRILMNEILPPDNDRDSAIRDKIAQNANCDLRQLNSLIQMYNTDPRVFSGTVSSRYLTGPETQISCAKSITEELFSKQHSIDEHNVLMNDTDRTIVALLFHENLLDCIATSTPRVEANNRSDQHNSDLAAIELYKNILSKICFADYMDRITFQYQIWQFNEMTSIIKTFHSHKILHDNCIPIPIRPSDNNASSIRFTKVLTKYSTEYNNALFVQNLCQTLQLDQKDCFAFFEALRNNKMELSSRGKIEPLLFSSENLKKDARVNGLSPRELQTHAKKKTKTIDSAQKDSCLDNAFISNIELMLTNAGIDIGKLFIKRIYRFLDAESIVVIPAYNLDQLHDEYFDDNLQMQTDDPINAYVS